MSARLPNSMRILSRSGRKFWDNSRILSREATGSAAENPTKAKKIIGVTFVTPLLVSGVGLSVLNTTFCLGSDNASSSNGFGSSFAFIVPEELEDVNVSDAWKDQKAVTECIWGGAVGFFAGYAFQKALKLVAVSVGTAFLMVQVGSRMGYIEVDWKQIEEDAQKATEARGRALSDKAKLYYKKGISLVKNHFPSSFGFGCGFAVSLFFM
eukprot:Nk52_evm43s355 gene=Nk52_evmTU43s355